MDIAMTPITPKKTARKTSRFIAIAVIASFALSACGIKGSLKTPPPIWGDGVAAPAENTSNTPADTTNAPTTP